MSSPVGLVGESSSAFAGQITSSALYVDIIDFGTRGRRAAAPRRPAASYHSISAAYTSCCDAPHDCQLPPVRLLFTALAEVIC